MIKAYAAHRAKGPLEPFEYDPGELGSDQVGNRRGCLRRLSLGSADPEQ